MVPGIGPDVRTSRYVLLHDNNTPHRKEYFHFGHSCHSFHV